MAATRIAILYGSETGTAQDFANILSHQLRRFHYKHTVCSIGEYSAQNILACQYLFVICSTTGQGALPQNARQSPQGKVEGTLWSVLKRSSLPPTLLDHLQVAFLGLGDSSYSKFNFAIRKLHNRIVGQLGAREIFPRLEADAIGLAGSNAGNGNGIELVYSEFEKRVLSFLNDQFPFMTVNGEQVPREPIATDIYLKPEYYLEASCDDKGTASAPCTFEGDSSVKYGTVVTNKRITATDHFQDVRQLVFSSQDGENYYPGDTVSIYPYNTDADVQAFIDTQQHWASIADVPLQIKTPTSARGICDGGLVSPLTLRNLLKYHCDIVSIPMRSFFMKTWTFAVDHERLPDGKDQLQQQRDKLREFAESEDMQDIYDYCNRPRRSILEVVQDFMSLRLPWEYILDYLPHIKPRFFSISSQPCNKDIELTIAIVRYKTILRRIRRGLCTNYISDLSEGSIIRYKVQYNDLLPAGKQDRPVIMISPGVGLAPMKCLIYAQLFNPMLLFFGNRYKDKDFLYADTLQKWADENRIKLFVCFSRSPDDSPGLKYVQDAVWENAREVARLITEENAVVYVCGSSGKMPVQVRLTLCEVLKKWGNFPDDKASEEYLKDMENSDRYLQETW
ncbi:FADL306Cp [Eremothecium gossypii FDAG1]|nr:FADL306Cp [Eremothecium gossypii FDAG1]